MSSSARWLLEAVSGLVAVVVAREEGREMGGFLQRTKDRLMYFSLIHATLTSLRWRVA